MYHACAATLARELGVEPTAPTREAYEALLPSAWDAEPQAGRAGGPPFVGRVPERTRLVSLWREAERGHAQLVLVSGEPGIGKTRLIEEFRSWCAHRGAVTAEARSYQAEGALAYGPVVTWLRSEAIRARLARIERAHLAELARLLPELLAEVPGLALPEPLPESEGRQRLFGALAHALLALGPLLLVADDLHWCDRETLWFLHYLLRARPQAPLLVVATARREEVGERHPLNDLVAGLQALERVTEPELERLGRDETAALAERMLELGGTARLWEAEARRLRAEFLAILGASHEEVEAELERALTVARRQGAKMFELRTAMSLLRHRLARGDSPGVSAARGMLAALFD